MKKNSLLFVFIVIMMGLVSSCGGDDADDPKTFVDNNGNNSGSGIVNSTKPNTTGKIDGHDYVDLGLSVKWATCNIGANNPEETGYYFAWGDANERTSFEYSSYAYYYPHFSNGEYYLYKNIGKNISGTQYDIARNKWSYSWRMPTMDEFDELVDKCTSKWMSYKGVNGRLFTGPNGNSLFLPAVGGYNDNDLEYFGRWGEYWSSYCGTYLDEKEQGRAYFFEFSSDDTSMLGWGSISRSLGKSVRPVTGNPGGGNSGGNSGESSDGGESGGSTGDAPYVIGFNFTATKTSITVKFMCNERPTSATIKYGTSSPTRTASSSVSGKQVSATVSGLKSGTKYYFSCTVRNSYGSSTSDSFPAITNF